MTLEEYARLDGVALADLVGRREVTAAELAQLALAAIESLNPTLNAVIETYPERTGAAAPQLDPGKPLSGVPMLLKDTGATEKGMLQECGSRIGRGYTADVDAYLTTAYRRAGLNILGRTTLPELSLAATTESEMTGTTHNPWDVTRSTGGSSGGSAAAVASGMVPVAHGTDTGGSIRIPAACCGLVGLKPSRGRISSGPALDDTLYGGLNTEHVLCRSVRDTAAVLQASCLTPWIGDPYPVTGPEVPLIPHTKARPQPMQIAFTTATHGGPAVDACMVEAVERVATQLAALGHKVWEAELPIGYELEACAQADEVVWAFSTLREVRRLSTATGNPPDENYLERPTLEALELARSLRLDDWFDAMATYNRIRRSLGTFFSGLDLLLTPTVTTLAPPLGTLNSNQNISFHEFMEATVHFCPHTAVFNITGQPAISLPLCASEDGLPIGVQLVARCGDEATLLQASALLEQLMPWHDRVPPVHATRG